MSISHTESCQGSKRTVITELNSHEPKRAKRNDEGPTMISPSHSRPTSSMVGGADRMMICQLCKAKKVDKAFLDVIEHREKSTNIPSRMNLPFEKSCSTCRLLLHARERKSKKYTGSDATYFYRYVNAGTPSAPAERIEAFRLAERESGPLRFTARQPRKDHIPDTTEFRQRMNRLEGVNFLLFTEQIRICQERHTRCQLKNPKVVQGLKVIDCRTRNIIQAQPNCAYVALSYVWGSGKCGDLQNPPKTIADALSATLNLGFNYLWIDRYCIDQQDAREKHTQIQQMGTIYRQAQVTIIAAAGVDPNHGLPGVSSNRPLRNPILLNQHVLYPMHQTSQEMISVSTWMSRAWTYQEFVLSRRRLFFTDQHAFLQCEENMIEELPASWRATFAPRRASNMGCNLLDTLSVDPKATGIVRFHETVRRYSMRNLTFASDALNGILGILSTFEEGPNPVYNLHGLPYFFDGNNAELPLYWRILHDKFASPRKLNNSGAIGNRQEALPSWSWTAWEGQIILDALVRPWEMSIKSTKISVELMNSDEKLSLEDYTRRRISGESIMVSPFIWVEGWTLSVEFNGHDDQWQMFGTDSVSKRIHMSFYNVPFTREDLLSGKRPVRNLIALILYTNGICAFGLLLEESTREYHRIGVMSCTVGYGFPSPMPESHLKNIRGVTRRSIRIG